MWLFRAMCPRAHCSGFCGSYSPWMLLNLKSEPLVEGFKQLEHCFIHGEYLLISIYIYLNRCIYQIHSFPSTVSVTSVHWAGWIKYSLFLWAFAIWSWNGSKSTFLYYYFAQVVIWTRWMIWNCCWSPNNFTSGKEFPLLYFPQNSEGSNKKGICSSEFKISVKSSEQYLINKCSNIWEPLEATLYERTTHIYLQGPIKHQEGRGCQTSSALVLLPLFC